MSFDEFLEGEINKPKSEWFDKNGNSPKAIVSRGFLKQVLWEYKKYPSRLKDVLSCFEGFETPIAWFIQIPFLIFLAPVLPLIWGAHSFDRAVGQYRAEYKRQKGTNNENN